MQNAAPLDKSNTSVDFYENVIIKKKLSNDNINHQKLCKRNVRLPAVLRTCFSKWKEKQLLNNYMDEDFNFKRTFLKS